jgi:hypothetical protein
VPVGTAATASETAAALPFNWVQIEFCFASTVCSLFNIMCTDELSLKTNSRATLCSVRLKRVEAVRGVPACSRGKIEQIYLLFLGKHCAVMQVKLLSRRASCIIYRHSQIAFKVANWTQFSRRFDAFILHHRQEIVDWVLKGLVVRF